MHKPPAIPLALFVIFSFRPPVIGDAARYRGHGRNPPTGAFPLRRLQMTETQQRDARNARHFQALASLVSALPRQLDDLVRLHPQARQQVGWLALAIGKTAHYSHGQSTELATAGNALRLFALSLLGEPCGVPVPQPECPMAERLAMLEAIVNAKEAE